MESLGVPAEVELDVADASVVAGGTVVSVEGGGVVAAVEAVSLVEVEGDVVASVVAVGGAVAVSVVTAGAVDEVVSEALVLEVDESLEDVEPEGVVEGGVVGEVELDVEDVAPLTTCGVSPLLWLLDGVAGVSDAEAALTGALSVVVAATGVDGCGWGIGDPTAGAGAGIGGGGGATSVTTGAAASA